MKLSVRKTWIAGLLGVCGIAPLLFQNCSPTQFAATATNRGLNTVSNPISPPAEIVSCQFKGNAIEIGKPVQTYKAARVPANQNCELQDNICQANGQFEPSLGFDSCSKEVAPPPTPTGHFACKQRNDPSTPSNVRHLVMDLYEKMSDGSLSQEPVKRCSNWQSQQYNANYNCGVIWNGNYENWPATLPAEPDCCPEGMHGINGTCMLISGLGDACLGNMNCRNDLCCDHNARKGPYYSCLPGPRPGCGGRGW